MPSSFRRPLLDRILSQPSAPFREGLVISAIQDEFRNAGVPHFQDPAGNIVVGVSDRAEYRKLVAARHAEPLRIFIAHMDHPGFHGVEWLAPDEGAGAGAPAVLAIRWLGGSPFEQLEGARVWLATREGWAAEGQLFDARLIPSGRAIAEAKVRLPAGVRKAFPDAGALFGGFGFRAPVWQEGELLYTKAADDLVGAFAIASLALDQFSKGKRRKPSAAPFLGLLTRAEEVGFIGAIAHFELGWHKPARRPLLAVSLETSRQLPGAEIGKGPVVRLGDKYTVFDAGALRVFTDLALKALPERHQRKLMDGGTCEATAATVYGLPCVGISVPLGNYHNQSIEGGIEARHPNGPAPEHVHLADVQGLLTLCEALLKPKLAWDKPWKAKRAEFRKQLRKYGPLLRSKP